MLAGATELSYSEELESGYQYNSCQWWEERNKNQKIHFEKLLGMWRGWEQNSYLQLNNKVKFTQLLDCVLVILCNWEDQSGPW